MTGEIVHSLGLLVLAALYRCWLWSQRLVL